MASVFFETHPDHDNAVQDVDRSCHSPLDFHRINLYKIDEMTDDIDIVLIEQYVIAHVFDLLQK